MPTFSNTSKSRLVTCHRDLQLIMNVAIRTADFSIICGHRDERAQEHAFKNGFSGARWGESAHNEFPSLAVDIAPYPVDWKDEQEFALLAGRILQIADQLDIPLIWGGHFEGLADLGHFELDDEY